VLKESSLPFLYILISEAEGLKGDHRRLTAANLNLEMKPRF
jgi:hypothetical protein